MRVTVLLLLLVAHNISAKTVTKDLKNLKVDVKDVGVISVKHEIMGEPIAQPERLEIFITCAKTKKKQSLKVFRMCKWESYSYEPGIKTLDLQLVSGRVDLKTSKVICDQVDQRQIDLSKACGD